MQEFIVSTLEDENDGDFSDGDLSLREAIALANEQEGTDTITIDRNTIDAGINGVIFFNNEDNLAIEDSVSIVAIGENQQGITIIGNGLSLDIAENIDVEIDNFNFLGGRIDNSGNLDISNSTFSAASDTAIVSRGVLDLQSVLVGTSGGEQSGVLIESGTAEIRESAIANNLGETSGLIINEGAEVLVSNSTIANNRSSPEESAAGITNAGSLSVSNSTIVGNNGGEGAGGIVNSGEATVTSTIVADNTSGANVGDISGEGEFTSGGFNLVGNGDDVSGFLESDIVGTADNPVDPLLRSLEINGGNPALATFALRELSPAIDNGTNPNNLTTDQRGLPRVSGEATDIGAVERQVTVEDENNSPQTITVSILEDEDDGDTSAEDLSLREAIALANSGDTITFNSSLSGGTINLSFGELAIDKSLTIEGLGADQLTIDNIGTGRVFNIDDGNFDNDLNITLDGLTITGGSLSPFVSNPNGPNGGGIFTTENLELINSSVSGNSAGSQGGGIYSSGDRLIIDNSTISDNVAIDARGGLSGSFGGGIATVGTTVEITGSSIVNNTAAIGGGGGLNFQDSQVTIAGSSIADNFGSGAGGINSDNSNVNIDRTVINGNSTGIFGGSGAIDSDANSVLTIDRTTIDANSGIDPFNPTPPRGSQAFVAGIGARGTTTITNSTITNSIVERIDDPLSPDNPRASIPQSPTGFGVRNTGDLTIINSTFSGNPDAGISNEGGTVNIFNTTLADGLANVDLTADDNSATVISTIVADDSQELEIAIDENSNLIGNSEDLLLGELQDNGGFTQTIALLDDSPAIDAGSNPSALDFDQRGEGFDRTVGNGTDIGAFELQVPEESNSEAEPPNNEDAGGVEPPNNGNDGGAEPPNNEDAGSEPPDPALLGDDVINGTNGDDVLLGGEGNNILYGFEGNDRLETGSGNDTLDANKGDDTLIGGDGNNILYGFDGNDVLETGGGNDTLDAGNGDDIITAGGGNDIITAGSGNDSINAGAGSDTIDGGSDADLIDGGAGDDLVNGNIGNDTLTGAAGNDTLIAGAGDDFVTGNGGSDLFVLDAQGGANTIQDFDPSLDSIGLADEITFGELSITGSSDAAIAFEGETIGIIVNIAATDLTADNFVIYEI